MHAPQTPQPFDPAAAGRHFEDGVACFRAGDPAGAVARWHETLRLHPDHPHAPRNLAVALKRLERWEALVAALRRLSLDHPADPWAAFNLGLAHAAQGRRAEAVAAYRRALHGAPTHAEARWNLAGLHEAAEDWARAERLWRTMVALAPDQPGPWRHYAFCRRNGGAAPEDAILLGAWRAVERLTTTDPDALNALAVTAYRGRRLEEAAALWARCRHTRPEHLGILTNLAVCLKKLGRLDEAEALFQRAQALAPDDPEVRTGHALLALLTGRLAEGGRHWEARHDKAVPMDHYVAGRLPELRRRPRWEGQSDPGIHLFIHAEQGLGDSLQYIRFVEVARARVGRVTVACQRPLMGVLAGCRGIDRLMLRDDPIPDDHTHHTLLMSLPHAMGLGLSDLAPRVPYLTIDPARVAARRPPPDPDGRLRVGLVWSGNPSHADDSARSIPLSLLAPLLEVPGVMPVSLQKGGDGRLADMGWSERLPSWVPDRFGMEDTAALILSLDLVIAVDTSVAHLAGALGRPVWLLLPFAPDWRWLVDREDSPWYPTMRLFRQTTRDDWPGVIARVAAALALAGARR